MTSVPLAFSSSLIDASLAAFLPVRISLSPLSANFLAQASPMPLVAPVIRMVLFIFSQFLVLELKSFAKILKKKCNQQKK
jgi:hypothetical protein